jgi:hypothetical protein
MLVAWLGQQGIEAHVKDRHMIATHPWISSAIAPKGVEVLTDREAAASAVELLRRRQAEMAAEAKKNDRPTTPVQATCEDCGAISTFPAKSRGRVAECPECGAYIDVPE